MDIMPALDIEQYAMNRSIGQVQEKMGVALLDMALDNAQSQGGALTDMMRSSMELSVNPDVGANLDTAI